METLFVCILVIIITFVSIVYPTYIIRIGDIWFNTCHSHFIWENPMRYTLFSYIRFTHQQINTTKINQINTIQHNTIR